LSKNSLNRVLTLLKSFKAVLDKEREAEKIRLEAREQAEKIEKEAQEKVAEIYREIYQETIAEAKRKSIEINEQAKIDAESRAQIFVRRAKKQKKKIRIDAEKKFDEAVNAALNEILS
jgi:flagellar biosynthesis/type III secretory pathway protein FliH